MNSSFETDFCGGTFWDLNATWYTDDPDFTPCFHKTVLAWAPAAIFLFFASFEAPKYFREERGRIPWNVYNIGKLAGTLGLVVLAVAEIALTGVVDGDSDNMVSTL
jgi:ATP-binding cassette subfamily C (CFTR/MRP) protein 1